MRNKLIIAGIIALIILAAALYFKRQSSISVESSATATTIQSSIRAKVQAKLPAPKGEMLRPSAQEITGKWITKFGKSSIAELILINGKFELIYTSDPQGRIRQYSKGNYKYDTSKGKITLYPSKVAGEPRAIAGVSYKRMTLRHYDILLSKVAGEQDIYLTAPEFQIIPKSFHPLFLYADYAGAPVLKFSPAQEVSKGK